MAVAGVLKHYLSGVATDFHAQELANIAWAFAKAGQSDAQPFPALARVMK